MALWEYGERKRVRASSARYRPLETSHISTDENQSDANCLAPIGEAETAPKEQVILYQNQRPPCRQMCAHLPIPPTDESDLHTSRKTAEHRRIAPRNLA